MSQALQFAGSLAAIVALFWLSRRLGLGGDPRLRDPEEARRLAEAADCGFEAEAVILDRGGIGALLRDGHGQVMLVRRHGARWAARRLDGHAGVRLDRHFLTLTPAEKPFGSVTLDLGEEAQVWAASLRRVK